MAAGSETDTGTKVDGISTLLVVAGAECLPQGDMSSGNRGSSIGSDRGSIRTESAESESICLSSEDEEKTKQTVRVKEAEERDPHPPKRFIQKPKHASAVKNTPNSGNKRKVSFCEGEMSDITNQDVIGKLCECVDALEKTIMKMYRPKGDIKDKLHIMSNLVQKIRNTKSTLTIDKTPSKQQKEVTKPTTVEVAKNKMRKLTRIPAKCESYIHVRSDAGVDTTVPTISLENHRKNAEIKTKISKLTIAPTHCVSYIHVKLDEEVDNTEITTRLKNHRSKWPNDYTYLNVESKTGSPLDAGVETTKVVWVSTRDRKMERGIQKAFRTKYDELASLEEELSTLELMSRVKTNGMEMRYSCNRIIKIIHNGKEADIYKKLKKLRQETIADEAIATHEVEGIDGQWLKKAVESIFCTTKTRVSIFGNKKPDANKDKKTYALVVNQGDKTYEQTLKLIRNKLKGNKEADKVRNIRGTKGESTYNPR
ncbi:hypothetical protein ABEB36_015837 [Hypothenemus hampei]|uniref:Uncharacterized protein n=1 Tax=Hypothenemus hampei TaxID=57062 RepID=A0ABD1DYS1_HYPHA